MSANIQVIHDEITETYTEVCRHCKKHAEEHVRSVDDGAGHCLFDSTTWDPMTEMEWAEWRKSFWLELGGIGTEFIRDSLRQAGFAAKLKQDIDVYGTASIEIDSSPGTVEVKRVDPMKAKNERLLSFLEKLDAKKP